MHQNSPKAEIEQIVNDSIGGKKRTEKNLQNSIKKLAEDLYKKDSHFIFELIQNAEDNRYAEEVEPELKFILSKNNLTSPNTSNGSLLVVNNEKGFNYKDLDGLCSIGESTKKQQDGFIGEKGIGFKSVFRITSNPHIYSQGYNFSLPEDYPNSSLGYIVPVYQKKIPLDIETTKTNILLPIDKVPFQEVEKMLRDIKPETILFLSTLKKLLIEIENSGSIEILKTPLGKEELKLTITSKFNKKTIKEEKNFLVHRVVFEKPDDMHEEKRENVTRREVSIAFPINQKDQKCGVFAYLPVKESSGLPFIINADFILPSSREDISEDKPWNNWLRDCVVKTYVAALQKWLGTKPLRPEIYSSIPLETHIDFLEPIIDGIQEKLAELEIIPTEPDKKFVEPERAHLENKKFKSLMAKNRFPKRLLKKRMVLDKIQKYSKQLKSIGVKYLPKEEIFNCFEDKNWFDSKNIDWIHKSLMYFFEGKTNWENFNLSELQIIPIKSGNNFRLVATKDLPVYLPCSKTEKKCIKSIPKVVKTKIGFLDENFFKKVKSNTIFIAWLEEKFEIFPFSKDNYLIDCQRNLRKNYQSFSNEEIIRTTIFLASEIDHKEIDDLPLVLSDESVLRSSLIKNTQKKQCVTAENFDPETGWQNIFDEDERDHFYYLSNDYLELCCNDSEKNALKKLFKKLGIKKIPAPPLFSESNYSGKLTHREEKLCGEAPDSTKGYKIENYRPLKKLVSFNQKANLKNWNFSKSLLKWLNVQEYKYSSWENSFDICWDKLRVCYFYYSSKSEGHTSCLKLALQNVRWIPTKKGFFKPSEVFLDKPEIRKVLGDKVPFLTKNLTINENLADFLGIQKSVRPKKLVELLENLSLEKKSKLELIENIYETISSEELDYDIIEKFNDKSLIFLPLENAGKKWFKADEVSWEDQGEVLGSDSKYLEKFYPNLKEFFVEIIGVKENLDEEVFARRWLELQEDPYDKPEKNQEVLKQIFEEIKHTLESPEEFPWLSDFLENIKFYSESNKFVSSDHLYVPDDGLLQKEISEQEVEFTWRPPESSQLEWFNFFKTAGVKFLKEEVEISLLNLEKPEETQANQYLTDGAKKLILARLKEQHSDYFEEEIIEGIIQTKEVYVDKLEIEYCLEDSTVTEAIAFWKIEDNQLYINKESNKFKIQSEISEQISNQIFKGDKNVEFAPFVESKLTIPETEINHFMEQNSWTLPPEIESKFDSPLTKDTEAIAVENNQNDDNEFEFEIETEHEADGSTEMQEIFADIKQNDSENNAEYRDAKSKVNIKSEWGKAFNQNVKSYAEDDGDFFPSHESSNPERRRNKSYNSATEKIYQEPTPEERRTKTERSILEGPEPKTREFLSMQYYGKCQICGKTFKKKDGKNFFVATYIVPRVKARFLDNPANALCLCADHFAKWRHGEKKAEKITDKIINFKTVKEGGQEEPSFKIQLCDIDETITFTEKHLVDLQALITAIEE
jgi:hypothetical protein